MPLFSNQEASSQPDKKRTQIPAFESLQRHTILQFSGLLIAAVLALRPKTLEEVKWRMRRGEFSMLVSWLKYLCCKELPCQNHNFLPKGMNFETKGFLQVVWGFLSGSLTCQVSSLVMQLSLMFSQVILCFILVQLHSELHTTKFLKRLKKIACFSCPQPLFNIQMEVNNSLINSMGSLLIT